MEWKLPARPEGPECLINPAIVLVQSRGFPEIASWQRDASVAGAAKATELWAEAVVLRPRTIHSFDSLDRCFSPILDSKRHREVFRVDWDIQVVFREISSSEIVLDQRMELMTAADLANCLFQHTLQQNNKRFDWSKFRYSIFTFFRMPSYPFRMYESRN